MTRDEIIKGLQSAIRRSEDAITANINGRKPFELEYERIKDDNSSEVNERISEIYTYIIHWPQDERTLRKEIELFQSIIEYITNEQNVVDAIWGKFRT